MSKGHKGHEEEHAEENSERWLLTYSDMITLLLALFIILYSMSTLEAKKFQDIAEQFGSAFHSEDKGFGGNEGDGSEVGTGEGKAGTAGTPKGAGMSIGSDGQTAEGSDSQGSSGSTAAASEDPLDKIYTAFSKYVQENHLQDEISLENTDTYVRIRIQGVLMFYPDSSKLLDSSKPIMKSIAEALMTVYDSVDHITISGHTASVGETEYQNTEFGWTLSVNRANTVRKALMDDGLKEEKLSLEGNGHNVPVSTEDTEQGRALNRRAEITVYRFSAAAPDQNMGSAQETASAVQADQAEKAQEAKSAEKPVVTSTAAKVKK